MERDVDALVAVLRTAPARTAILLDFDGTLAPIVDDPARAIPLGGVTDALRTLGRTYRRVAVISGRPVRYLQDHLPSSLALVGLYGLEEVRDGEILTHPDAHGWRGTIDEVATRARTELPEAVGVEHKGLSLTLHVRQSPDLVRVVDGWATAAAARTGLFVRRARMSAELHPPIDADKGTAVRALLTDIDVACFVGDDVGDVPAFDALDAHEAAGGTAVRFVVDSPELDPALRDRADVLLDGPPAVLAVLRALIA